MQKRSPVLVWLLLNATTTVDAVVAVESWRSSGDSLEMLSVGLAFGQLSVLCIWAIFAQSTNRWRWLYCYLAATLAGLIVGPPFDGDRPFAYFIVFALFMWMHVSFVLGSLWALKQYRFSNAHGTNDRSVRWQLSMLQLLIVTTVMALTFTLYAKSKVLGTDEVLFAMLWTMNNAVLAVCGVLTRSLKLHTAQRLALLMAVALASCVAWGVSMHVIEAPSADELLYLVAVHLVQAIVLFLWMECVPIVSTPTRSAPALKPEFGSAAGGVAT